MKGTLSEKAKIILSDEVAAEKLMDLIMHKPKKGEVKKIQVGNVRYDVSSASSHPLALKDSK